MRGCVSAGASAALNILGIHDTIDVVYGRYYYYFYANHVGICNSSHFDIINLILQ
jgi:hypothetical protein